MYKSINGQLPDSLNSMLNHAVRSYNGYYIQHVWTNNRKFTI